MPEFRISKDHLGVLRLQRRAYPGLVPSDQETIELACALFGHLVQRNESLTAADFLSCILQNYVSTDARQAEVERVIELCIEPKDRSAQAKHTPSDQSAREPAELWPSQGAAGARD